MIETYSRVYEPNESEKKSELWNVFACVSRAEKGWVER